MNVVIEKYMCSISDIFFEYLDTHAAELCVAVIYVYIRLCFVVIYSSLATSV